ILGRPFLKTRIALIDVFEGELTLRVGKEAITFNLDQTSRYSANYSDMTAKRIDVIDIACEEYSQEVLGFSDTISSVPISEPAIAPVSASKPNPKASILYPSRRNGKRNREKANNEIKKFYQIFKDMSFKISFVDALILMPKFASTLKDLIGNKEKLSEMARTPLNEH
nr:reverse transcriptase domain-containing protein [Tanacetum cinerariifolium]